MGISAQEIEGLVECQRAFFRSGATRKEAFRREGLVRLGDAIKGNLDVIYEALWEDLRKPPFEAFTSEIAMLVAEIEIQRKPETKDIGPILPRPPMEALQ